MDYHCNSSASDYEYVNNCIFVLNKECLSQNLILNSIIYISSSDSSDSSVSQTNTNPYHSPIDINSEAFNFDSTSALPLDNLPNILQNKGFECFTSKKDEKVSFNIWNISILINEYLLKYLANQTPRSNEML